MTDGQIEEIKRKLPTFEAAEKAVDKGTATALEQFIHDNEPAGAELAEEFRTGLAAVLAEHNSPAPSRKELKADG